MHELSIAISLVDQIIEIARTNKLQRVDKVEIEAGVLRQVIPEMMQTAFKEATDQTVASEAALDITEIQAKAKCNQCATEFEPEIDNYVCPQCQIADVKVFQGNEIILKSISCDVEDDEKRNQ